MTAPEATKTCRTCHQVLDVTEFYPSKSNKGRLRNDCKQCDVAKSRRWHADHRERRNQIQRAYYRRKTERELDEWRARHFKPRPTDD